MVDAKRALFPQISIRVLRMSDYIPSLKSVSRVLRMADYIPPELIAKILARLPIADVVRCTSVCISWYEIITSSEFISLHLNLSISNTHSRVIVGFNALNAPVSLHSDNETFDEIQEIQFPGTCSALIAVCGSSNGLLCCLDKNYNVILWNPSLHKTLNLETSLRTGGQCINSPFVRKCTVGFGFLPYTNNYKIVKIIFARDSQDNNIVKIYSSCTRTWNNVDVEIPYVLERNCCYSANLNGILHWIAYNPCRGTSHNLIASFDLSSEKFKDIMLPKSLQDDVYIDDLRVSVLKESLCLIHKDDESTSIYIMKEYGISESWEELYTIDYNWDPLYIRLNGEILSFIGDSKINNLASYDPEAERVVLDLGRKFQHCFFAYAYVDSLNLIKRLKFSRTEILLDGTHL